MRTIKKISLFIIYLFTFFIKPFKKTKIILFESVPDLSDNAKALYDYLMQKKINKSYKIYWLVNEPKEYSSKKMDNTYFITKKHNKKFKYIKTMFIMSIADYCFFTHCFVGNKYNKHQVRCFLMHGTSFKNLKNVYKDFFVDVTDAIVTSKFTEEIHCQTKQGVEGKCHVLGYPRNDMLYINQKEKNNLKRIFNLKDDKKIILWLPTFKHSNVDNRNDLNELTPSDVGIISENNLNEINNELEKYNIVLILKPHPGQDMKYFNIKENTNIKIMKDKDLIDNNYTLYQFMAVTDALITDFSSAYVDYLLLDKPIAFEIENIEQYKNGIGFSIDNPLDYMPGMLMKNKDDLIKFIESLNLNQDKYDKERKKMKNLFHTYKDNKSSERIIKYFKIGEEK